MNGKAISLAVVLGVVSLTAVADPQTRAFVQGSSFLVYATNNEDRAYNCNISYTLSYESGQQNFKAQFYVRPNLQNGVVHRSDTSWNASTLTASNVSISCT